MKSTHKKDRDGFFFLAPALIVLVVVVGFPMVFSLALSFTRWNYLTPDSTPVFIGLENFIQTITDPEGLNSAKLTGLFVLEAVLAEMILGILLAATLIMPRERGVAARRAASVGCRQLARMICGSSSAGVELSDGPIGSARTASMSAAGSRTPRYGASAAALEGRKGTTPAPGSTVKMFLRSASGTRAVQRRVPSDANR